MENADSTWIAEHRAQRLDWIQKDALKLQKEYARKGNPAPAWFLGSPRAAQKLIEKHLLGEQLLASTELAEMASRSDVARYRFSRLASQLETVEVAHFPASGMGLDILHFLNSYPQFRGKTWAGDLSPLTTAIARANIQHLLGSSVSFCCYDALSVPFRSQRAFVYLDPARRSETGRLERFEYLPNLEASLGELEKSSLAQIKCAPGETPDRLEAFVKRGWTWEWIQRGRDLVECFGTWRGGVDHGEPAWTATALDGEGHWRSSYSGDLEGLPFFVSQPLVLGQHLVLPKAVLLHSQLYAAWLKKYALEPSEALGLCVGTAASRPLCDNYRLLEVMDSPKTLARQLSTYKEDPLELRCLEHPVPKDWHGKISPFLRQKGDPTQRKTLLLTRRQGRWVGLLLERIESAG